MPIVDITDLASKLEFDTGSGINRERMAMSLQTPRGLTAADVARLRGVMAAATSFAVDEAWRPPTPRLRAALVVRAVMAARSSGAAHELGRFGGAAVPPHAAWCRSERTQADAVEVAGGMVGQTGRGEREQRRVVRPRLEVEPLARSWIFRRVT